VEGDVNGERDEQTHRGRRLSAGLTCCLSHPEEAEADGYPIGEVEKMFMRLA
jgi:hypothetical protein